MPEARYTIWQALEMALRLATRANTEVRLLAARSMIGPKGDPGPRGEPGRLPLATKWVDRVHRQLEVVTHEGAIWQAQRDTGRPPPHEDWLCIVSGRDGADGQSFRGCGLYSTERDYQKLDVVMINSNSFFALRDHPGPCPGEDWQLLAPQGRPGKPGLKGDPGIGIPGPPGSGVVSLTVGEDAMLKAVNADGSVVTCDLYPLLRKLER